MSVGGAGVTQVNSALSNPGGVTLTAGVSSTDAGVSVNDTNVLPSFDFSVQTNTQYIPIL